FEKHVTVRQEADEQPIDKVALPDDDGADLLAELVGEGRGVLHLIVDRGDAGVHRANMDSGGKPEAQRSALPASSSGFPRSLARRRARRSVVAHDHVEVVAVPSLEPVLEEAGGRHGWASVQRVTSATTRSGRSSCGMCPVRSRTRSSLPAMSSW